MYLRIIIHKTHPKIFLPLSINEKSDFFIYSDEESSIKILDSYFIHVLIKR